MSKRSTKPFQPLKPKPAASRVEAFRLAEERVYQTALDSLRACLKPDGPVEDMMVRDLARFQTRLTRYQTVQTHLLTVANSNFGWRDATKTLISLQKMEASVHSFYKSTLRRLERWQRDRHLRKPPQSPSPESSNPESSKKDSPNKPKPDSLNLLPCRRDRFC